MRNPVWWIMYVLLSVLIIHLWSTDEDEGTFPMHSLPTFILCWFYYRRNWDRCASFIVEALHSHTLDAMNRWHTARSVDIGTSMRQLTNVRQVMMTVRKSLYMMCPIKVIHHRKMTMMVSMVTHALVTDMHICSTDEIEDNPPTDNPPSDNIEQCK